MSTGTFSYVTAHKHLPFSGHNLGLVILPFLIDFLAITYGWRGTLLILGGLTFNLCALSSLYRPIQEKQDQNGAKKPRPTFNLSVLKKSSFICFCVSNVLVNTGQGIYILHLPAYAKSIGFSPSDIGIVLTIYGLSNAVGKLCFSVLGQHPKVDVSITYAVSLTIAGICMGLAPVFLTRTGMMILPGFVGFFFCVTCAFLAAVILRIVGQDRFADGVGVVMPFKATGNLIGGPIAGELIFTTSWANASYLIAYSNILKIVPPKMEDFQIKKILIFSCSCSKHSLWVLVRTASARRF